MIDYIELVRLAENRGLIKEVPSYCYSLTEATKKKIKRLLGNKLEAISRDIVDNVFAVIQDESGVDVMDFIAQATCDIHNTRPNLKRWAIKKGNRETLYPEVYLACIAGFARDYGKEKGWLIERGYNILPVNSKI